MAYTANEWRVQVRGNVGASESWNNTWTFLDTVGSQDPQDVMAILGGFYNAITTFASWLSTEYSAVGATAKNLNNGVVAESTGFTFTGSSSGELLPTQLAMRVSLADGAGHRGGPFLTGFVVAAVDGSLIANSCVSDFINALEDFTDALTTAGWQLRIDRPSANQTVAALAGRVGHRFDVIRKRANDTAEAYSSFTTS